MPRTSIEAIPPKYGSDTAELYFLVTFTERLVEERTVLSVDSSNNERVRQLEEELAALRDDMRTILDKQEAINGELQSVNEEIVLSNEELEASK